MDPLPWRKRQLANYVIVLGWLDLQIDAETTALEKRSRERVPRLRSDSLFYFMQGRCPAPAAGLCPAPRVESLVAKSCRRERVPRLRSDSPSPWTSGRKSRKLRAPLSAGS